MHLIREFGSLASRGLNVLAGGYADESLSARAHVELPRLARFINALFFWEENHCRVAWRRDIARSREMIKRAEAVE